MEFSVGTRLGPYEILAPLGSGGMGEVYRARDSRLGREVAIKVLPTGVAGDAERLARFEREARAVAGLNHPNIVTLHSVEDAGGVRFLTMELVEGQTLSNAIVPGGIPLPRLLDLAVPLTDALAAAHEKGVVHRDLKPGNVMVARDGRVKVLDFGLAKMMGAESAAGGEGSLTETTQSSVSGTDRVVGTIPYMAPEQVRGDAADARSDLFSLGVVLYELATGRRPFTGRSSADVASSILRDVPEPLRRSRPDLPGELEQVVGRCLEKDPRERIQSALEVNHELRRLRTALERGEPARPASDKVASIAVLPFVNRSASADDEYFADGLADELLAVLSKIQGLRVTARSSSTQFKGTRDDTATIGRKLNVATLLEGSVRKSENRIRVSVQLVNVADSSHLWSETYDRTLEDIFAVQEDIAQSVVKELRAALLGEARHAGASGAARADVAVASKGRGTDPEAHRLYLLARHLLDRYTREDTARAIEYLKEALARDPEHVLAWVELGGAYEGESDRGWAPVTEGYRRAREALERALALDPDLPEAHAHLGTLQVAQKFDFRGAEASFARALELSPGSATVLRGAGIMAFCADRLEEAIELHRRAVERDPLSAANYHNLGFELHSANRFGEAEAAYRRALELGPQRSITRANLALTLLAEGRGAEALEEAGREPEDWARLWALAIVHHGLGRRAESDAALRELTERYAEDSALQIAEVHGARGERDMAFAWLERAYAQRDPGLAYVKPTPRFRSLHGDPRWGAFLRKMGLEAA